MSLFSVVNRLLNKAGDSFIEARREDGHGSDAALPSFVELPADQVQTDALTNDELRAAPLDVNTGLIQPTTPDDTQPVNVTETVGLTNAQLRSAPIEVTGSLTIDPPDLQQVADDYQTGEILPDQIGNGGVLDFTFSAPVQNLWVYAVRDDDSGEVRVDPFGGTPSANLGIPVAFGGITPIPTTATVVRVFAETGVRVTVYGNRRT